MVCKDFLRTLSGLHIDEVNKRLESMYPSVASYAITSMSMIDTDTMSGSFIALFLDGKNEGVVKQAILWTPERRSHE